jgi:uncharacterized lipoprotein YddW (UPF0748 family)
MLKHSVNRIFNSLADKLVWFSRTQGRPAWIIFLLVFSLIIAVMMPEASYSATVAAPTTQAKEIRGVWLTNIDSDVLFSSSRIDTALQRLKQLNFNTVYPTVWQCGYTLYPSTVAAREIGREISPNPSLQGRDMLKEIVRQGHQKGIAVIPWFEFGFMAPAATQVMCEDGSNPVSELAKRHPDWLTSKRDGTQIVKEGNQQRVWLNPFHPQVQQFILDLMVEIVDKYDVDGIQVDDHFGLPADLGYDPFTVALYQKENPGLSPPANPQDTYWVRWRADKINQFMRRAFKAVKARKPKCIISASPNPLHFSLPAYLQDWFTWEREGLVEEIIVQVYRNDLKRFITELNRTEVKLAQSHIPVGIGILSGLKGRPLPIEQIQTQVQEVRKHGLAGVSFFFYESLWNFGKEPPAERQLAFKKLFPTPVEQANIYRGWKPTT